MPTKRTRVSRQPQRSIVLRRSDLTIHEYTALCGIWWEPGTAVRAAQAVRFFTWPQFLSTYEQVCGELMAERRHWPPFAECLRSTCGDAELAREMYRQNVTRWQRFDRGAINGSRKS